ncbi:MAG: ABC transporter substrate-binding protein, partial [Thermodesulfobacteriota bacterium]|nr:ABC transporter substrate-binding protein [Thermodesulfobacteriota bacterium]
IYDKYLSRFPDGHLAAEALMKKGLIHTALGKNGESRTIYNRLIAEYPSSPVASDARVEILVTFFNQGNYKQLIRHAADVPEETFFRVHILRTYSLVGDSYMAIGSPAKALNYYLMAYTKTEKQEKEEIILKIESAAKAIDPATIISLLTRFKNELPVEYFIYRVGLGKVEWKKYEDAVGLLSEFIKKFPGNKNVQPAKKIIQDINEKFTFKHNMLGCLLPLSGPYTIYGNKILKCIEMALAQFNSQNNRSPIKLIVKDTESDPEKAVQAVCELSEERIGAIIGPVTTHEAAALEAQIEIPEQSREKTENSDRKPAEPAVDFEAVFIPDGPTTSGLLVPQLAFYDVVGVHLFGTNLWHSDRLIQMAKQFIQGAIMADGFFAGSNSQKVKDFVEMFEETFHDKPGFIEAVAYDTAMILFDLVSRNDIQSRSEIKNEIMNLQDFQGVTGTTSFDNTGNAHKKLYLLQIQGDKFIEMENNS